MSKRLPLLLVLLLVLVFSGCRVAEVIDSLTSAPVKPTEMPAASPTQSATEQAPNTEAPSPSLIPSPKPTRTPAPSPTPVTYTILEKVGSSLRFNEGSYNLMLPADRDWEEASLGDFYSFKTGALYMNISPAEGVLEDYSSLSRDDWWTLLHDAIEQRVYGGDITVQIKSVESVDYHGLPGCIVEYTYFIDYWKIEGRNSYIDCGDHVSYVEIFWESDFGTGEESAIAARIFATLRPNE